VDPLALLYFPYPHVFHGERREGLLVRWPKRCSNCDRQCEQSTPGSLQLCSYGVNYQRISPELLIAGIVVRDYDGHTDARGKMLRAVRKEAIRKADLELVIERSSRATNELELEMRKRKDQVIAEYKKSGAYRKEIIELMRPDLEQTLGQVHDYKQVVQQIIQNLDVHLESRFPNQPLEEKVEKASHSEAAIYWAARVMEEKLDAALFVLYPDRVANPSERRRLRFHGVVTKYAKIYRARVKEKRLKVHEVGESWATIEAHPRALPIIPHALIDNAIKYAPRAAI
jgi:hypothetical protein